MPITFWLHRLSSYNMNQFNALSSTCLKIANSFVVPLMQFVSICDSPRPPSNSHFSSTNSLFF